MSRTSTVVLLTAWTVLVVVLVVCLLPKPVQGRDISRRQQNAHRRPREGPTSSSALTERSRPHRRRRPELPGVVIESTRCTDCGNKGKEAKQSGGRRRRDRHRHPRRRKENNHDKPSTSASHPRPAPRSSKPTATLLPVFLKGRKLHPETRHSKGKKRAHLDTSQMQAEPPALDMMPQRDFWDFFNIGGTTTEKPEIKEGTKEETKEVRKEDTTPSPTTDAPTDSDTNPKTDRKVDSNTDTKKDTNTRRSGFRTPTKKDDKADNKSGDKKETRTEDKSDTKTNTPTDNVTGNKRDSIARQPVLTSLQVQRPSEADRLERRLHPNLDLAIRDLVNTMDRVMQNVGNRLINSGTHYDMMYNYTRHSMMQGSRELLKDIVVVNDGVYGTLMQASQMTKQVYVRAHHHNGQSSLTSVPASLDQPQLSVPSLRDALYRSRNEHSQARSAKGKVDDMLYRCERQTTRLEQMRERVDAVYGFKALEDLKKQLTRVMGMLRTEFPRLAHSSVLPAGRRPVPPSGALADAVMDILEGEQLLEKARTSVRTAEFNFDGMRRALSEARGPGAPVELKAGPSGGLARHRRQAGTAIHQALLDIKIRAVELQEQARYAERLLRPLINQGRSFTGNHSTDSLVLAQTLAVRDRLMADIKSLHVVLDRLRLLVGNEEELRARCQELGEEQGSGSGPDGDGESGSPIDCDVLGEGSAEKPTPEVPEAGGPDTGDFEFIDEVVIGRAPTSSSISRFGRSLKTYVLQLRQQCEARLQRATTAKTTTSNMSRRLRAVEADIARVSVAGTDIKNVRNQLQRQEAELRGLSSKVKAVHAQVEGSHNASQQRALEALARAQRRLQEVQGQGSPQSRGATARPNPSSGVDLTAALTKAAEARRAMANLQGESEAVSGRCGSVVDRVTSLQTNIAQLRQRLHLARLLLASTQVSMQKRGAGYVAVPVEGEPSPPSLLSQTQLCLRPAGSAGTVLLVKGNNSMSYHLEMASKKLSLTAYDHTGSEVGSVQSDRDLTEDEWYRVRMLREGSTLSLTVTSSDGQSSTESGETTSQSLMQPEPASVFIGGAPSDLGVPVTTGTWEGCVGGLQVNGRTLPLTRPASDGEPAQPCSNHCSTSQGPPSLVFHGQGFLHLSEDLIRLPVSSLDFRFRTTQHNAFLLALISTRQRYQVRVLLSEGTIVVETHTRTEQALRISTNTFSDGHFHRLQIQFRGSTSVLVDGQAGQFTKVNKRPDLLSQAAQGVLVGAMLSPDYAFSPSSQGGLDPLIGCVRDLKINEKEVSPGKILEARGVNFGSCSNTSVWATCARFGESSRAYEVPASAEMRVSVLVSPAARGPLLLFAREKDYSLQLELDSEGLTMSETVQENTRKLAWPKDSSQLFLPLSIQDDGSSVLTVLAWEGQSFTLSYKAGWFYARSSNPTSLTLGTDDEGTRLLQGDVTQLLVNGKLVNLAAAKQSHGFLGCSRGLPSSEATPTQAPFTLAC